MFKQSAFNNFICENQVIGFFDDPITLKSGKQSNFYINWRTLCSDVYLLNQCSDFILSYCQDKNIIPDCFYGVPEGATKLALITQYKLATQYQICKKGSHGIPMGRSKAKEHGAAKDKYFIGKPEGSIILLEDVTTTGQSIIEALDRLLELNCDVKACLTLSNREPNSETENMSEKISKRGVPYFSMSLAKELIQTAFDSYSNTLPKSTKLLKKEIETLL